MKAEVKDARTIPEGQREAFPPSLERYDDGAEGAAKEDYSPF